VTPGQSSSADPVDVARRLVAQAHRVVVLSGAGISTDSGIPDFRGPNGVWTRDPKAEKRATLQAYIADPTVRREAWQTRLHSPAWSARPNAGHRALVTLEHAGRLDTLVTQNIDGLHHAAGSDSEKIIEIHGTMREVVCLSCGHRCPMDEILDRVRAGEDDPECLVTNSAAEPCGGMLKSAVISFGQNLVPADLLRAEAAASRCDLLLAVGTTLGVYPAAGLVPIAAEHGAPVIICNAESTPYDAMAAAVVGGSLSEVLPSIVAG
jgi:NAD-dependent deacetylase